MVGFLDASAPDYLVVGRQLRSAFLILRRGEEGSMTGAGPILLYWVAFAAMIVIALGLFAWRKARLFKAQVEYLGTMEREARLVEDRRELETASAETPTDGPHPVPALPPTERRYGPNDRRRRSRRVMEDRRRPLEASPSA
jgi:hypothetical protein